MPFQKQSSLKQNAKKGTHSRMRETEISWICVEDLVYRTRLQRDPDMFAEITPAPANQLSIGSVAKFPTKRRKQISIYDIQHCNQ